MGTLIDKATGRHLSWTGAVIQDLSRTDQWRGHYWRVTDSWRDANTGAWQMTWTPQSYLGSAQPLDEPIYKYDGTTWDMKAVPSTVFPTVFAVVNIVVGLTIALAWAAWSPEHPYVGLTLLLMLGAGTNIVLKWLRNIEPVTGTAITAAVTAATVARAEYLRGQERERVNGLVAQNQVEWAAWQADPNRSPLSQPAPLQSPGSQQWS